MAHPVSICVGTVGQGIWQSSDGGEQWARVTNGISFETEVRAFAVHPQRPEVIFAGTDQGLYRSDNAGKSWTWMEGSLDVFHIWALAINPHEPEIMYAGTRPSAIFRSVDGGVHWQQLSVDLAKECPAVRIPRVTALIIDPIEPSTLWAGIEVDGVRRSTDAGETWDQPMAGLTNPDIHGMAISAGPTKTLWVSTNSDIFRSLDNGASWQPIGARQLFPYTYCRGLLAQADHSNTIFAGIGDYTPGSTGSIQRSTDGGQSWYAPPLSVEPNTAMWCLGGHATDPRFIVAASLYGYLYCSADGGDSWTKLRREFSEVRAVMWTPA